MTGALAMPWKVEEGVELYAPASYQHASPAARAEVVNGCGPKGKGFLVPDTFWGLSISPACDVHDWMYHVGATIRDKDEADRVFFNNCLRIINAKTRWNWLRNFRHHRAKIYYEAVRDYGGPAFWAGKNLPAETIRV